MRELLKIMVIDGNPEDRNAPMRAHGGQTSAERYAAEIARVAPDAELVTVSPCESDAYLPAGVGVGDFDGAVLGGSALHVYESSPEVTRQIDLMRTALDAGVPVLGSCWGLQVAAVATGGTVSKSPKGREVGIARKVMLSPSGVDDPLFVGKAPVFDSPCIHYDEVTQLPSGGRVLASNGHSVVQAAVIDTGQGVFRGMQYHPEFDLAYLSIFYHRFADEMVRDGFFADQTAALSLAGDLADLHGNASRLDLRWRLGIDDDVLDPDVRCLEIRNWLDTL